MLSGAGMAGGGRGFLLFEESAPVSAANAASGRRKRSAVDNFMKRFILLYFSENSGRGLILILR